VIVHVIVINPVIVAALGNGNGIVALTDTVDSKNRSASPASPRCVQAA
jgi:hypothetical protein